MRHRFCARFMLVLGALLLGLTRPAPAPQAQETADFFSGEELFEACQISKEYCLGYVTAVADVMARVKPLYGVESCPPPGTSKGQKADTVTAWLEANPDLRYLNAASLTAKGLAAGFPCE